MKVLGEFPEELFRPILIKASDLPWISTRSQTMFVAVSPLNFPMLAVVAPIDPAEGQLCDGPRGHLNGADALLGSAGRVGGPAENGHIELELGGSLIDDGPDGFGRIQDEADAGPEPFVIEVARAEEPPFFGNGEDNLQRGAASPGKA